MKIKSGAKDNNSYIKEKKLKKMGQFFSSVNISVRCMSFTLKGY